MAGRISFKMKNKRAGKSSNDKASDKSEEEFDTSILSKPLETSINNITKILKLYQTTTEEIRGYLVNECDILYECRVCRSIFRSLSNFILHKRLYCEQKYDQNSQWPRKNEDEYLDVFLKEAADKNEQIKNSKKNLNAVIDGLTQKKQFGFEIDNFSIEEFYKQNQDSFNNPISNKKIELEQIQGTSSAVFQILKSGNESKTKMDDIKLEALEIQQLTEGQTAVLGPDGKVVNINQTKQIPIIDNDNSIDSSNLTCKKCNITFTTRKTFLSHVKYKHDSSRLIYPCLECSDTFVTVWGVYRHLYNIHRKTVPEVRKMRSKIQARAYRNKENSENNQMNSTEEQHRDQSNKQQKIDELNQEWMDNFESDNDIQMCGGCGRRFERRAALNSHSQTCQKRIAAKNIINSNKQKRIAAAEEKTATIERKTSKVVRTETEVDKKYYNSFNAPKKRKIGIQIRCDYSKPVDKMLAQTPITKTNDYTIKKNPLLIEEKSNDNQSSTLEYSVTYMNKNTSIEQNKAVELQEAEVVSIPSSNSSPCKDDSDPLAIKDLQSSSDSEVEEIRCNEICEDEPSFSKSFQIKNQFEDDKNETKLSNANETTLQLIDLINSDIKTENHRPTLDEKMANYVNLKKIMCIPCDTKFGNLSKLRYHMSAHFNWWKFRCDICTFKAYDKTEVILHVKENHNIQNIEKIDAIIFQIPDWETYELCSKVFIEKNYASVSSEQNEIPLICTPDIDGCIIIDPEPDDRSNIISNKRKVFKKNKNVKTLKKNKNIDSKKEMFSNDQSDNSEVSDNDLNSGSSSKSMESSDPKDIRKMVYQVIFGDGDDTTDNNPPVSTSSSSEEKDNVHVITTNDVSNVISRPVRNRVKHIDKDFIYDLSEFKEQQKTVLVPNSTRSSFIKSVSNQISELLEDNMVMVSGNGNKYNKKYANTNKTDKNSSKRYIENMGNIVKTLNLQKKVHTKFDSSHNQQGHRVVNTEEFSRDKITIVDPKTFLNDNSSEGDDDIYIVENEELVAVNVK